MERHITSEELREGGGACLSRASSTACDAEHPRPSVHPNQMYTQTPERRRPFGRTGADSAKIMQELRHRVQNLEQELAARDQSQGNASRSHGGASQSHARTHSSPSRARDSQGRSLTRHEETHTQATSRTTRSKSESRWGSQKEETRRQENPIIMGATPFHPSILKVRLPRNFDKPTDMRYDGTKDPQEHVTTFEERMNLEGVGDAVRCRAFPVTLAGPAIRWFNTLPQGSITTFADISQKFLAQFTTCIAKAKHPINLLGVTQKPGEPTRKFLDRFNDECLEIDDLTDSVASLCLTNGLLNEDFRKHLTTKPVWTMQEIQSIAKEYINDEEVSQVVAANKRQPANPPARQTHQLERYKEAPRDGILNKLPKQPRVGRFTNYTPLTAPIVEVYQQIADKRILSRLRPLKERTGGNKSLYCDYHKGFGHKTQDCFDLKDALEQAIRKGKLSEFSRLIREPRRRERERSEEDRNRAVKPRQEPTGDASNPPTFVVNIVVGLDSPPKSKSATRKDSRVLSISTDSPTTSKRLPTISFGPEDIWFKDLPENPPMEVTAMVGTGLVRRILVDTRADSNILFRNVFDAMGLKESDLKSHQHGVMGLGDNYIRPDGTISLPISLGTGDARKSVMADFVVLRDSTAYNIILGRKTINEFSSVI
ncbi:uncharacterized protein [Arachis hypogaea]|uniref:uncharacterized protein n=1 Tax=Arachis hypogaea TaxID=3818 RepID=UPI000DECB743|nr:uncharacterized protein LOC112730647 [Arachis hypogaea]